MLQRFIILHMQSHDGAVASSEFWIDGFEQSQCNKFTTIKSISGKFIGFEAKQ